MAKNEVKPWPVREFSLLIMKCAAFSISFICFWCLRSVPFYSFLTFVGCSYFLFQSTLWFLVLTQTFSKPQTLQLLPFLCKANLWNIKWKVVSRTFVGTVSLIFRGLPCCHESLVMFAGHQGRWGCVVCAHTEQTWGEKQMEIPIKYLEANTKHIKVAVTFLRALQGAETSWKWGLKTLSFSALCNPLLPRSCFPRPLPTSLIR